MNEKQKFGVVVLGVFLFSAGYLLGTNATDLAPKPDTPRIKAEGGVFRVGFVGPLSGDASSLGENMKIAVELARDEINAKGGINGKYLEVLFEDGRCESKQTEQVGRKLIEIDKVSAIIGGVCSSETFALAPLAEKNKVPLLSAASTNPDVTVAGAYTFRFVPSDDIQGTYTADYIVDTLKKKKVALLTCESEYCKAVGEAFKKRLFQKGGSVAVEQSFARDARSLYGQIARIRSSKPEAVYFVAYASSAALGLKQMKYAGLTAPVIGVDVWDDPVLAQAVKKEANGVRYITPVNQPLPTAFIDEMKRRTGGKELVLYAPRAYDSLYALALALAKSNNGKPETIREGIARLNGFLGIADTYTLDINGDLSQSRFAVKEFKDGAIIEVVEKTASQTQP